MTSDAPVPQFSTAEYASQPSNLTCAACRHQISGSYFQIKGAPVCAECTDKIRAQIPKDSHAAFVRAVIFGIVGAVIGCALYVAFTLATGIIIGFVSLAVGLIVGKAMQIGSRGVGGRRYQIVAVLLTYLAVSMATVPIALHQLSQRGAQQQTQPADQTQSAQSGTQPRRQVSIGRAIVVLAGIGIASPILELQDPVHGVIGLIILFVGLRFAWQFTAQRTVSVSGPYTAASAGAT